MRTILRLCHQVLIRVVEGTDRGARLLRPGLFLNMNIPNPLLQAFIQMQQALMVSVSSDHSCFNFIKNINVIRKNTASFKIAFVLEINLVEQ